MCKMRVHSSRGGRRLSSEAALSSTYARRVIFTVSLGRSRPCELGLGNQLTSATTTTHDHGLDTEPRWGHRPIKCGADKSKNTRYLKTWSAFAKIIGCCSITSPSFFTSNFCSVGRLWLSRQISIGTFVMRMPQTYNICPNSIFAGRSLTRGMRPDSPIPDSSRCSSEECASYCASSTVANYGNQLVIQGVSTYT